MVLAAVHEPLHLVGAPPGPAPEQRHWLSLVSGLALVQALREEHDVDASLKWPNDVLIGVGEDASGRKIAGSAAMIPPGDPQAVILGCGINVLQTAEELPTPTSTSLLLETSEPLGRTRAPTCSSAGCAGSAPCT